LHFTALDEDERYLVFSCHKNANINVKGEISKLLLSRGANVNARTKNGTTTLHAATYNGYVKVVEALLEHNADVNCTVKIDIAPLRYHPQMHYVEGDKVLLKFHASIDSEDKYGITPLHIAAENDNLEIVKFLLKFGAIIDSQDKCGITPLRIAAQNDNLEIVKCLLKFGAIIDSQDKYGITPLQIAAHKGHLEIVKCLLKFGAIVDSQDEYGRTALHIASKAGHKEIVIAFLEHGSDINIMSKDNWTPLDFANAGIRSFYNRVNSYYGADDYYYYYVRGRGICACEIIADILKHHMVKMKAANLFVSKKNLRSISSNDEISNFQNECEEEIASMKTEKVSNTNVSFYNILTKGISQLAIYAGNDSVVQILSSDDYKIKFPIYASMINSNFRKGERRKELLEKGNEIFHFLFNNFPQLPHNCTEKIFGYLSDEDLRILIDACKPISVSSPNNDDNVVITSSIPKIS
jgi:ankyrin repeat protein